MIPWCVSNFAMAYSDFNHHHTADVATGSIAARKDQDHATHASRLLHSLNLGAITVSNAVVLPSHLRSPPSQRDINVIVRNTSTSGIGLS